MAKLKTLADDAEVDHQDAAPPDPVPTMMAQAGAMIGDPVVLVRLLNGSDLYPCLAKDAKQRQIVVDGHPCEHVETAPSGTWIYQMRAH